MQGKRAYFFAFFLSLLIYAKCYFARDALATLADETGSTRVSIPGGGLPCRWGHFVFLLLVGAFFSLA